MLSHKLREAMAREDEDRKLFGEVEIDGAYFGGYVKPANDKDNRRDRRLLINQTGKRQNVVVMRERGGQSVVTVHKAEAAGVASVRATVDPEAVIHADEASHWDALHAQYEMRRINHSVTYSDGLACTNMAESFVSRLRRMEIGTHHHIAGTYLSAYAGEASWREDNRREANGTQAAMVGGAPMASPVSRNWKGYWQRGQ